MKPGRLEYALLLPMLLGSVTAASASGRMTQFPGLHRAPWSSSVTSTQVIHVSGAEIQIDFAHGDLDISHNDIVQWVKTAANAVSLFYGKSPVARVRVLVLPIADEAGVLTGTTWGNVDGFPAFTRMRVGQHTTEQDLANDWTMTHELVHMALPSLSQNHHWLEEGLATYIEPIARSQAGTLSPEKVWGELLRNMPKGEPGATDQGLNQAHSWASTYWGGALFCLVADVSIREQTQNSEGLQDALRAIVAAGGPSIRSGPSPECLPRAIRPLEHRS